MVWRIWFRLRRPAWIPWVLAGLVPLLIASNLLALNLWFTVVPPRLSHAFALVSLSLRVVLAVLMLVTAFQGIRDHGLEGWAALPAVVLAGISSSIGS